MVSSTAGQQWKAPDLVQLWPCDIFVEDLHSGSLLLCYHYTFSFSVLTFQSQKPPFPTFISRSSVAPLLSSVMFHLPFLIFSFISFFSLYQILFSTHMFVTFYCIHSLIIPVLQYHLYFGCKFAMQYHGAVSWCLHQIQIVFLGCFPTTFSSPGI